jgi:hypothetical protein
MYLDSKAIGSNRGFEWSEEDISDPTSVSNGGWDQKLDHSMVSSLKSWASKSSINRNYYFIYLNTTMITNIDLRYVDCPTRSDREEKDI